MSIALKTAARVFNLPLRDFYNGSKSARTQLIGLGGLCGVGRGYVAAARAAGGGDDIFCVKLRNVHSKTLIGFFIQSKSLLSGQSKYTFAA